MMQQLPGGGPKVVGLPIAFDHVQPTSAKPAPRLGEHTREVLREYGFDDEQIDRFEQEGAIVTSMPRHARKTVA